MKLKWVATLLAAVAGVGVYAGSVLATPQTGVTTLQLAKGTFGDLHVSSSSKKPFHSVKLKTKGVSDVYVVQNTFDPGGQTGWHTHPGPSMIIVASGSISAYEGDDPTCTAKVYKTGDVFTDPGDGHVHLLRNETAVSATTIAVQFLPTGATRKIDVTPAPGNCPF